MEHVDAGRPRSVLDYSKWMDMMTSQTTDQKKANFSSNMKVWIGLAGRQHLSADLLDAHS